MGAPIPTRIKLHKASRTLELGYADGSTYQLPAEYLRVLSPSAEVRRHGKPVLQTGKQNVGLSGVETAGRYAIKLIFDELADQVPDIAKLAEPKRLRSGWINGVKELAVSYR